MLNLNTNNDYSMTFHHISSTPNEQQFYHNLYSNTASSVAKDKSDGIFKSQKIDYGNSSEFTSIKDGENSKRFSVNNLLKPPTSPANEKFSGK